MSRNSLIIDAWMREAEEASQWVEDLESRIKNKNLEQLSLVDSARSKLLGLGVKLDRLESLLRNPHSKPTLTDEDLDFRWNFLSDIQLRTKSLAGYLYALPSFDRPRSDSAVDANECTNRGANYYYQDKMKASCSNYDSELLKPLRSDDANLSEVEIQRVGSFMSLYSIRKACSTISLFLGIAALLFIVVLMFVAT
ncbi:Syntaxin of plants 52, putative isoform 2 [Quillaja saponaria]|uniref:Syntaxin of plants 52, putative isoform 2 n=1 Tax=Quillaja saponaria TaxID=32244 RepID=A0AAD7Q238_QUISA|nr:Syntaxin of plants 52, putative isoform 2 [Quillaja saponaria]